MDGSDAGSMDFMEGIVATMAVAVVLTAFLGLVAGMEAEGPGPLDGIDPGELTGEISGGVYRPFFEEYIAGYADAHGLGWISVSISVPGGFCDRPEAVSFGEAADPTDVRRFSTMVGTDDGRRVISIVEVSACA